MNQLLFYNIAVVEVYIIIKCQNLCKVKNIWQRELLAAADRSTQLWTMLTYSSSSSSCSSFSSSSGSVVVVTSGSGTNW